ncbi:ExeA family protein [Blautia sp. HCP3S3_D9]|uniref:ExeA family protein n=1 Tax=Blautia sp. HCP3S3_D9 TaxID=3438912 RepID=UPI003F8BD446
MRNVWWTKVHGISFRGKKFETRPALIGCTVGIAYDPMVPEILTVSYHGMEPFTVHPLKIGAFCDKNPSLPDSKLTPRWFYKSMLDQLGIESKFYRGDAKRQLQKEVEIIRGVQKKKVVCILDEAHLLEKETIEEFRFLLNYRFDSMSPMALILARQTELWDKLRLQRYAAVRQRIDINCVLPHFDRAETERYILSHLVYAGGRQDIFTDRALDDIYKESTGIPRRINRICEKSLMYASQQGKRLIDEHLVRYIYH